MEPKQLFNYLTSNGIRFVVGGDYSLVLQGICHRHIDYIEIYTHPSSTSMLLSILSSLGKKVTKTDYDEDLLIDQNIFSDLFIMNENGYKYMFVITSKLY